MKIHELHRDIDDEDIPSICRNVIDDQYLLWSQVEQHQYASSADLEVLERKYDNIILKIIIANFNNYKMDLEYLNKIKSIIFIRLTRLSRNPYNSIVTGIVICGYGKDDLFPASNSFIISGKLNGKLIYLNHLSGEIHYGNPAHISGYAQHEMVDLFTRGRHPDYRNVIDSMSRNLLLKHPIDVLEIIEDELNKVGSRITDDVKERVKERIQQKGEEKTEKHHRNMDTFERQNFANDILGVITNLPKDELGVVAETFVNLASFQRKITPGSQTVGGPIDVAIISRKDGFVWVKRKHYFNRELNPHKK